MWWMHGELIACEKAQQFLSFPITGQKPSSLADEQRWKGDLCCPRIGSRTWGRRCLLLKVKKKNQTRVSLCKCWVMAALLILTVNVLVDACLWAMLFLILGPSLPWYSKFEGRMIFFFLDAHLSIHRFAFLCQSNSWLPERAAAG